MRWLIRIISSLLILMLLLALMVFLMPKDRIARMAESQFTKATGRVLEIGDTIKPTIWPVLGVTAGPVRIKNPDWSTTPDMLAADRIAIGLDLFALFDGRVAITEIEIDKPDLVLEQAKDGRVNWAITTSPSPDAPAESESGGMSAEFTLDQGVIRNGRLRYIDHASGTETQLDDVDLATAIPDLAGPVALDLQAMMRGQPFSLTFRTDALAPLLAGQVGNIELDLKAGGNSIAFNGRAGLASMQAEGRLEAVLDDRPALGTLMGQPFPELPEGFGARSLSVKSDITLTPKGSLHLRGAEIGMDGATVRAEADWQPGTPRTKLTGRVVFDKLVYQVAADSSTGGGNGGWPKDRLDASALSALDAEIALNAKSVAVGPLVLGPTRAVVTIDRARAVFGIAEAAAYDGKISGEFVVNNRNGLSVGGALKLEGLQMQPLLSALAGSDRLAGRGDAAIKFLGSGESVDAILRSLSGNISMQLGKGEILGLDIAGMLRTMDPGYVGEGRKTIFRTASLTATIAGGIASSDDLLIDAKLFRATGTGKIDIGAESVNYRLMPRLLPKEDGSGGVEIPILIKGPWAAPRIQLDLEWLAQQKLDAEKIRAEERAKERLEELAHEKLKVETQEGESLEDAAKRRANEAIEAETGRILEKLLKKN